MATEDNLGPLKPESSQTDMEELAASKWPLPFNVTLDKLDLITKAFFQAKADSKPILASSLNATTGLNVNTLGANAKFLAALGILKPESGKQGMYSLTSQGAEYAKAVSDRDEKRLAATLQPLMRSSPLEDLVGYIELQKSSGELKLDHIFAHIKTMARLPENLKYSKGVSPPYAYGISTLIELLKRAEIIPKELESEKEKEPQKKAHEVTRARPTKEVEKTFDLDEVPPNVEELKMGEVRIWLPKNDRPAAELAKKLIDLYLDKTKYGSSEN